MHTFTEMQVDSSISMCCDFVRRHIQTSSTGGVLPPLLSDNAVDELLSVPYTIWQVSQLYLNSSQSIRPPVRLKKPYRTGKPDNTNSSTLAVTAAETQILDIFMFEHLQKKNSGDEYAIFAGVSRCRCKKQSP